jgi:hypothetical protein
MANPVLRPLFLTLRDVRLPSNERGRLPRVSWAYPPNSLRQNPLERSSSELLVRGLFTEPPPELVVLVLTPSSNKSPAKRTSNRASLTSTETLSLTSSAQPLARPEEEPMQPRAAFCGLLCFQRPPSTRALGGSSRSFRGSVLKLPRAGPPDRARTSWP